VAWGTSRLIPSAHWSLHAARSSARAGPSQGDLQQEGQLADLTEP